MVTPGSTCGTPYETSNCYGVPASLHLELIARGAILWEVTTVVMEELRLTSILFKLLVVLFIKFWYLGSKYL